jgi:microcystin-dependent protein
MNGSGEEVIGSISTFAGNFAPMDYFDCDGRILPVQAYAALYSIINNIYGGDPGHTFALPDLRPFAEDGQPDTGHHHRVDWATVNKPRQVICYMGIYPTRP